MPTVLAVRHASTGKDVNLTYVRSVVRPLAPPFLRLTSFPHRVGHVGRPVVRGREDVAARSSFALSFSPPPFGKTFSRCPMRVLKMRSADSTEQELGSLNDARADPTEHELGNLNGIGADPTEHELRNLNGTGADPTEQELGNWNGARADPTKHELGN
ncbi:hypothetical protein B296_00056341 [Ensete ventricosum]|uniref:Uncharacterized protein n=1 Tax=Ensete ventricosum TaxID=4639 RepID=A0A426X418_ENSVE|nr:hypothetical protein B296_00056341 [Ensete ventricosum]